MEMGVGVLVEAMSEGSGWRLVVEILSFYLGGGDAHDIPGLIVGRIHLAGVPRSCQPWDIPST